MFLCYFLHKNHGNKASSKKIRFASGRLKKKVGRGAAFFYYFYFENQANRAGDQANLVGYRVNLIGYHAKLAGYLANWMDTRRIRFSWWQENHPPLVAGGYGQIPSEFGWIPSKFDWIPSKFGWIPVKFDLGSQIKNKIFSWGGPKKWVGRGRESNFFFRGGLTVNYTLH